MPLTLVSDRDTGPSGGAPAVGAQETNLDRRAARPRAAGFIKAVGIELRGAWLLMLVCLAVVVLASLR